MQGCGMLKRVKGNGSASKSISKRYQAARAHLRDAGCHLGHSMANLHTVELFPTQVKDDSCPSPPLPHTASNRRSRSRTLRGVTAPDCSRSGAAVEGVCLLRCQFPSRNPLDIEEVLVAHVFRGDVPPHGTAAKGQGRNEIVVEGADGAVN